ncbi:hypothetical protein ACFLS8_05205, partial [Chloroflexota bacterium]
MVAMVSSVQTILYSKLGDIFKEVSTEVVDIIRSNPRIIGWPDLPPIAIPPFKSKLHSLSP